MADLGGLIKDVQCNKFLDSVTIPRQCTNQDNENNWEIQHRKGYWGNIKVNGAF